MKFMNTMLSVCALLVVAVSCYASQDIVEQTIMIKNESGKTIYGGVYLTNAAGKIYNKNATFNTLTDKSCRTTTISKSQKTQDRLFKYYKVIFSDDQNNMQAKISNNNGSNVFSATIKQLSGGKELQYLITEGKSLLTGNDSLKIERKTNLKCTNIQELGGRIEAGLEVAGERLDAAMNRASQAVSNFFSSPSTTQPARPSTTSVERNRARIGAVAERQAARQ